MSIRFTSRRGADDRSLLGSSAAWESKQSPTVAPKAVGRRLGKAIAGAALFVTCTAGCGQNPQVLPDEEFRNFVPSNAELLDEVVDDGGSLTIDGERSVLRTFGPVPPADPADVLELLVAEGQADGWLFTDRSAGLAVATKEVDGRPWMVSVVADDDTVRQLFAGR